MHTHKTAMLENCSVHANNAPHPQHEKDATILPTVLLHITSLDTGTMTGVWSRHTLLLSPPAARKCAFTKAHLQSVDDGHVGYVMS